MRILKPDGALNFLRKPGKRINGRVKPKREKELNRFPAVFKLNPKSNGTPYKTIPLNKRGKVEIETDVTDDYLFRSVEKGRFKIEVLQKIPKTAGPVTPVPNSSPNETTDILDVNWEGPTDGTIKLLIKPNAKAKVGDRVTIKASLSAPGKDLECVFDVRVDQAISEPKRKKTNKSKTYPDLPKAQRAFENPTDDAGLKWTDPLLNWGGQDIAKVISEPADGGGLVVDGIVVNMDSFALKRFLSKNEISTEREIIFQSKRYFNSVYIHSLYLFSMLQQMKKNDEQLKPIDLEEFVSTMMKPYANLLLFYDYELTKKRGLQTG